MMASVSVFSIFSSVITIFPLKHDIKKLLSPKIVLESNSMIQKVGNHKSCYQEQSDTERLAQVHKGTRKQNLATQNTTDKYPQFE